MFTAWEQWNGWHAERQYTTLPLLKRVPLETLAVDSWERAWQDASPHAFVLESGKDGRYTYLGLHPASVIRGKGLKAVCTELGGGSRPPLAGADGEWEGKPLELVRRWMSGHTAPKLSEGPKWTGGCVGYWSYDIIRSIERLPELAADDLGMPDYLFMRMDELWIVDKEEQALYCAVHSKVEKDADTARLRDVYEAATAKADAMSAYWNDKVQSGNADAAALRNDWLGRTQDGSLHIDVESMEGMTSPFSKAAYMAAVERIREYIAQGDVFQVNLSLRQSREVSASPEELYEWLRIVNPSPYMGFLRTPDFQLVSASPELLVEQRDGLLATRPIAGTRRRGKTEEEDRILADELLSNEKERAEHIMLVDLERNDLGRIAAYGSVHVEELMVIERYSHVMHLVSQVEGKLAEGKDAYDVIAATFPGGTITGAPKIRTMEIIEELEPTRRGSYTGSLGWIDYNGDMEFNIIIRTMAVKDGLVHVQAGAGIVIDSDPEREYYESLSKAKALWKAVQFSEQFAEQTSRA
ncbi:anthranilate synthase component I family protein [Paenibacillus radicis (ex Gao et al. 2016)]|uniref:Aminodeoxychorismate synthase component 1 n=1 Tax=Paenibacillus radicis (ex Gao et al. 2016) TaxID=1737354 RepID=A0A917MAC8_9BACL|nr:anthranilate synthase component I family protein [Paenibacillus radicis (ex Gao et al. 2016)]GGG87833.1 aminodeoxychorismate synthase component 1 [Paenibacillus radicis (ex Gao et al. 2016)]